MPRLEKTLTQDGNETLLLYKKWNLFMINIIDFAEEQENTHFRVKVLKGHCRFFCYHGFQVENLGI